MKEPLTKIDDILTNIGLTISSVCALVLLVVMFFS